MVHDKRPTDALHGQCLCGAVTYKATAAPLDVVHCHCTMCRRHSGAAFLTYARFDRSAVTFAGARPVSYRSSSAAQRGHCGTCGSPLTFVYDSEPDHIYLTAGTLDEASALTPSAHWFTAAKLSWLHLDDGLPQWPALPEG